MVEFLRPQVSIREQAQVFAPPGVPTTTAAFIGVAERGKLNEPVLISSLRDYRLHFGGFFKGNYLPLSVFKFFANGGGSAWIVRIAGAGAAKASKTLTSFDATNTLQIDAFSEGAWGNSISIGIEKFSAKLTIALPAATAITSITLSSVSGLEIGDIILVDGGTGNDKFTARVHSIDIATNVVTLGSAYTTTNGVPAGSPVVSASMHRASTKLKSDISSGTYTQVEVVDASGFRPGMVVTLMDGTNEAEVILDDVNGDFLIFASASLPALVAANSRVVSQEFKMKVYEKGIVQEVFDFLALSSVNTRDFIENKLKGNANLSRLIEVSDLGAGDLTPKFPEPGLFVLSGGQDGAVPTDADFIGDPIQGTGMFALDSVEAINYIAIPGITSASVHSDLIAYAEQRSSVAVLDMPLAYDTAIEMVDYKKSTLNSSSSYAAIYGPWLRSQDPENRDQEIILPPSGFVMGMFTRVASSIGIHKAPANEELTGTFGPIHLLTDAELDLLDPAGINPIVSISGRGIRVMGSNTLHIDKDGLHEIAVRFVTNFIKASVKPLLQSFLFQPNNAITRATVQSVLTSFMSGLERTGALVQPIGGGPAFVVQANEENNTQDDVLAQKLNVFIGFVPVLPIKYIDVLISISPAGISVAEAA